MSDASTLSTSAYALPVSLQALIDETQGQRDATWEGRQVLILNQAWGSLVLSREGGQVLHYAPRGQGPWLWMSSTPKPLPAAIRGGIPVCWPRFADEASDIDLPFHGIVRKMPWQIDAVDGNDEGVEIHISPAEAVDLQLFPRCVILASAQRLRVELITEHRGTTPVRFTQALHTYLAVQNTHSCRVEELTGARYIDKMKGGQEADQVGELAIRGPLDRIYHSAVPLTLDDGNRRLRISKEGSDSSVIWHPGIEGRPADVPEAELNGYLCVEAACTRLDPIWLPPGGQHLLAQELSLA